MKPLFAHIHTVAARITFAGCLNKRFGVLVAILAMLPGLAACGQAGTATPPPTQPAAQSAEPTGAPAPAATEPAEAASEPVRIEGGDGPPFYARFGENETFGDAQTVAIVFYRPTECIPDEFNLNAFFDFPGETGPGAFGCGPLTSDVIEYWATGPGLDPAPVRSEMTGRGAVPVWFFDRADITNANADGVVTITELEALPSRRVGAATTFTELLLPSQSNAEPMIRFRAEGSLEDGGEFLLDVSYGVPDVTDHTTIEID